MKNEIKTEDLFDADYCQSAIGRKYREGITLETLIITQNA